MGEGGDAGDIENLNILYNIADVVNKTAGMVWYAATMDTKALDLKSD